MCTIVRLQLRVKNNLKCGLNFITVDTIKIMVYDLSQEQLLQMVCDLASVCTFCTSGLYV